MRGLVLRSISGGASIFCAALLLAGCPCPLPGGHDGTVTLTPIPTLVGSGFAMSGPYGLDGYLIEDPFNHVWSMSGTFTFPTPGYAVGAPQVVIAESFPEQVTVTLTVIAPDPSVIVPQVLTEVPFEATFSASSEARITVRVQQRCIQLPPQG